MSNLLKTPLTQWHIDHGAKMAPFAGWEMPIQYEGILAEHKHTRENAAIFDICHMGQFIIENNSKDNDKNNSDGQSCKDLLSKAVSHNLETLAQGKCRYGFLLSDEGTVLDDLIIYRLEEEKFLLVVNAACIETDYKTLVARVPGCVKDISNQAGKIDLQGPKSLEVLESTLGQNFHDLKYFSFVFIEYKGESMMVSRTGYTGELGYELYPPRHLALNLWEDLAKHEAVKPVALGARDTLRLEAGYCLYGHELNQEHSPAESAQGGMLTSVADYIGKTKAQEIRKEFLVSLQLEGRRTVRADDLVYLPESPDTVIGKVTSGSFAPSLGYAVALAFVQKEYAYRTDFLLKSGKSEFKAVKVNLPFYTKGTARIKLS